jgi:glycosyltransferase involved in cell wall biosynthesis
MKIAFYMTTVLEHPGGCEKYMIETAANLAKRSDLTIDAVTMDDRFSKRLGRALSIFFMKDMTNRSHFLSHEEVVRRLGKAQYYKTTSFRELCQKLQGYDVIYSKNELLEACVLKFLVGYKHLPPIVFGGHTPLKYPQPQSFHAKLHNYLYDSPYRWLAGKVHKFHVLNDFELGLYKHRFPEQGVFKIYNPFDIAAFRATKPSVSKKILTFDDQAINILWVGRLTEQKGVNDLVHIIRTINGSLHGKVKIAWNICGDGEQRAAIEQLAAQESNVQYFGQVDLNDMAAIQRHSHMFLSTSKWEGYPYVLIEPQAFGLQIFGYNIPGVSDILKAYDGGHLADNLEDMVKIVSEQLTSYKHPDAVPRSEASSQFDPEAIYDQLCKKLFGIEGTETACAS